jgi:hypothetical protein
MLTPITIGNVLILANTLISTSGGEHCYIVILTFMSCKVVTNTGTNDYRFILPSLKINQRHTH